MMEDETIKKERRHAWGDYFLSRADDDSQWGNGRGVNWRPKRNEDLSWRKFFWIFVFNFPLYFVALGIIESLVSYAWALQGLPGFVNGSADSIKQFLLGLSCTAGFLDFGVCSVFRSAWNRRARQMRDAETVMGVYE